jgi:hypothetical protein
MKTVLIVLSIGFIILGIVGLGAAATLWLSWLVLLVGALGLIASFFVPPTASATGPLAGGVGVAAGILWLIGLATHATGWLNWWTFAFALGFILLGVSGYGGLRTATPA